MKRNIGKQAFFFDGLARKGVMAGFDGREGTKARGLVHRMGLRPGDAVFEPGCGSGRFTVLLADAVSPRGRVFSCDVSGGMLRIARKRGLPARVRFKRASADRTGTAAGSFDVVVCFNAFPHFQPPGPYLREWARILAPRGRLFVAHTMSRRTLNRFHRNAGHTVSRHTLPPQRVMRSLLKKAGFGLRSVRDGGGTYLLAAQRLSHGHVVGK